MIVWGVQLTVAFSAISATATKRCRTAGRRGLALSERISPLSHRHQHKIGRASAVDFVFHLYMTCNNDNRYII